MSRLSMFLRGHALIACALCLFVASSSARAAEPTFTLSGSITGLRGSGLVLSNGSEHLAVAANGTFTFPTPLASGTAYNVTVVTRPSQPAQGCLVANARGKITANVTNVTLACVTSMPQLRLLSSTPAPEATGISRTQPLVLNFSAPLNAQTVDAARVMLRSGNIGRQVTLTVVGAQITLTPSTQLAPATSYTIVVRSGLRGAENEVLSGDLAVNFTTSEASWRTSQVLSLGSTPVTAASISSRGDQFAAVWRHENDSIALRRYAPRTGWSDLTILDRNTRAFVNDPQVFLDAEGTAHVIYNNNSHALEYSRHTLDSGWSPVEQIVIAGTDQRVGPWRGRIDAAGNLIVVWTDITGESSGANNYNIRTIRHVPGSGWGAATRLNNENYFSIEPGLAVDATGNAIAIWKELHDSGGVSHYQLWSRRYAPASGWATAQRVDGAGIANAEQAQIALDRDGKAVAVYTQAGKVMVNSAYRTTDWVGPLQLQYTPATTGSAPQVAFDASGKAFVTWIQSGAGGHEIWRDSCAANLPPLNCWLDTQRVVGATREFRDLRLAINSQGSELLVVTDVTATSSSTLAIRNVPGRGWVAQPLDPYPGATSRSKPQLATDASGSALAIWFSRYPDTSAVEASVFE